LTKISVVSTFHKPALEKYGQRFLDSFSANVDPKIEMLLYAEDCKPVVNDPRIKVLDQKAELPKLVAFKERWKDVPKANGVCPPEIKARRPRDWHKEFKWDAIRFSNKVYAVFDAAQRTDADWIVWMDADSYIHQQWSYESFKKFLPDRAWLSYLGRGKKWPECGFYGINLKNKIALRFLQEFEHVYEHAEYGIFRMEEWHDSFVFEEVRKKIADKNPTGIIHNISGGIIDGEGHPVINSDLGQYMDHLKGDRKDIGKSNKPNDLRIKRYEPYWQ